MEYVIIEQLVINLKIEKDNGLVLHYLLNYF